MLLFLCTVSSLRGTKKLGRRQAVSVHHLPTLEIERVEVDSKMGPQCSSLETRGKKWDPIPWCYSFFLLLFVCFVPWHTVGLLVWVVLFCRSSTVLHFHDQDPPPDSLAIGGQALMWWLGHVEWHQVLSIECCPPMWYCFAWFPASHFDCLERFRRNCSIHSEAVKLELSSTSLDFAWVVGRCRE